MVAKSERTSNILHEIHDWEKDKVPDKFLSEIENDLAEIQMIENDRDRRLRITETKLTIKFNEFLEAAEMFDRLTAIRGYCITCQKQTISFVAGKDVLCRSCDGKTAIKKKFKGNFYDILLKAVLRK